MDEFEFRDQDAGKGAKRAKAKQVDETPEVPETEGQIDQLDTGVNYTDEELEAIYDSIMFESSYNEEVSIGKRIKVTFRTRNGKEAREVMMRLDKMALNMGITVESIRSLYNLAQSVLVINGVDISGEPLDKKLERIEVLPTAVLSRLMLELSKFDVKVAAAISHGEENF